MLDLFLGTSYPMLKSVRITVWVILSVHSRIFIIDVAVTHEVGVEAVVLITFLILKKRISCLAMN